jgi:subfamily B ATP-binding cassette protein MsbA
MLAEEYTTSYIVKRLIRNHIRPYLGKIFTAIFFMIIVAACSAIMVRLVEPVINDVLIHKDKGILITLSLTMIVVSAIKGGAEYMQSFLVKVVGQRILTDLQILMYAHLLKADLALIEEHSSGRLISRFSNDISLMRGAVSQVLVGVAKHCFSVIFLLGVMLSLEPMMFLICFGVFPIAIYPIQILGRRMRKIAYLAQEELGNYTATLDETFHSIKVVKSYRAENYEVIKAGKTTEKIYELYKKAAKLDALTSPIMETLSGIAVALILCYGGWAIMAGKTTPGALFAFITAFVSAYRPYKSLVALNVHLQEGLAAAKRLFQILDIEAKIQDLPTAMAVEFKSSEIEFHNVSLSFGEKIALSNISFSIKPNTTVAIVGKSGGGKTSLANLLVRFYDPTAGAILINGHEIKNVTLNSLRGQIALVSQDTMLFDATISENIAYGCSNISQKDIIEAARKAHADEFVDILPEKYNTMIGNQGATLSGGQKQRLSIARAFLKNAPILILDEATSSLDSHSELAIEDSLRQLRQNRTTIIITHKLANIIEADNIIVLKKGHIIESGSHYELMKKKNEYYNLYNKEFENT